MHIIFGEFIGVQPLSPFMDSLFFSDAGYRHSWKPGLDWGTRSCFLFESCTHTHTHINGINVGYLYIIHIDTLLVVWYVRGFILGAMWFSKTWALQRLWGSVLGGVLLNISIMMFDYTVVVSSSFRHVCLLNRQKMIQVDGHVHSWFQFKPSVLCLPYVMRLSVGHCSVGEVQAAFRATFPHGLLWPCRCGANAQEGWWHAHYSQSIYLSYGKKDVVLHCFT